MKVIITKSNSPIDRIVNPTPISAPGASLEEKIETVRFPHTSVRSDKFREIILDTNSGKGRSPHF